MPVRIRLSRVGAKKRPFYRIVVADSRRARDGRFIDRIGTYNPMLPADHAERIKINADKAKDWIQKGAQPSDRVHLFLSNIGILDKPIITEKTKQHLPRKKTQERLAKEKEADAAPAAKEESPAKEKEADAAPAAKEEVESKADAKQSVDENNDKTKPTEQKEKKKS